MTLVKSMNLAVILLFALTSAPVAFAAKKSKKTEEKPPEPVPEMRIDPNLIQSYQAGAALQSERFEKSGVQILAVEPALDFHSFKSFYARNDYFEIPLSGDSSSTTAPSVWVGHPTGAVWFKLIRARAGLDLSYLGYDGVQTVHQRTLNMDFRDNISAHVFPVMASGRLDKATDDDSTWGFSPWFTAGAGMMLTQVSGNLDGSSQSAWSPVSKIAGGLRYSLAGQNSFLGGVSAGVFRVSGSSKKAQWYGSGVTLRADVLL